MEKEIRELTKLMRSSDNLFWERLRFLLKEKDIDPSSTVLAMSHEDDECFEFGILVLPNGEAIQYGISYLNRTIEEAEIIEWNKLSESYIGNYHSKEVEIARSISINA